VDLEDEHQRLVARFEGQIRGLDWLPDDSALVFTARWKESLGLWRLGVERGELTRLDFGQNAFGVTTSRNSNRLVFSQLRHDCNIWRVSGPGAKETSPPTRFIATTAEDRDGWYSPDGSKVVFVSTRLRENQIWVCLSDGTNCKQLTPIGANAVEPWWSPSGDAIAFTEMSQGNCEVYTIDVNAGIPFRLTRDDSTDVAGSWSGDGQWVYFISDRTGQYEIWRTTVLGKNTEQLTFNGGNLPIVSPDDQFIYYMKLTAPTSIWRLSLESHIEELICEADIGVGGFNLWNNLVIYILQDSIEGPRIESFDVETRRTHIVADLGENTRLGCYRRHSLSPDGQWMLFTRDDGSGADLVLVDAFQ
jgi:Tol biopolymer transport system component